MAVPAISQKQYAALMEIGSYLGIAIVAWLVPFGHCLLGMLHRCHPFLPAMPLTRCGRDRHIEPFLRDSGLVDYKIYTAMT